MRVSKSRHEGQSLTLAQAYELLDAVVREEARSYLSLESKH
jgi:hypothetical protein